jgi:hypothetical protein
MARIVGCLLLEPVEACWQELDAVRSMARNLGSSRGSARSSSANATRIDLPHWQTRPMAQRPFAGKPLVEWVVRRASEAQQLDELVVVVPETATVQAFKDSLPAAVRVVQAKRDDRLGRLVEALASIRQPASQLVSRESTRAHRRASAKQPATGKPATGSAAANE